MSNKQTLKLFTHLLHEYAYMNICEFSDMMNVINALEKQIPKKVIKEELNPTTNEEMESWSDYEYRCPVCNKEVFRHYCEECGQALDWEV